MDLDIVHVTRYMSLIRMMRFGMSCTLRCNYAYVIFYLKFSCYTTFFNGASLLSLVFQMRLLEVFIKCSI